uniref:Mediator of RNA polymerase II transcription subunit 26 n=1 Tax=Graphocephala atropunctata TaxID=36148 RepID=A0A1B6MCS2_9HEMI
MSAISAGWLYVGWGAVTFETNYGLMQLSPPEIKEKLLRALDKEYNVVDMVTVLEIVSVLEKTNITKEALETTRLGKYINELRRKTTNDALAKRAKDLVRRWRDMILPQTDAAPPQHNGSARLGAASRGGGGTAPLRTGVISPAMSIPSSTTSPALSQPSRGDAVPKTHAANKRLRKETLSPNEKPPAKVPRVNGTTFRPDTGECSRDSSDRASDGCEIVSVVTRTDDRPPETRRKGRKKGSKNHSALGKEISQAKSSDDIVKEKIASIARTPRVKTTLELLADLKSKTDGTLPADIQVNLVNCVLPGSDELTRNKTEHIAKFLRSQSELVNDDSIDVMKPSQEELRPCTDSLPSHSTVGPAQSSCNSSTVPPSPAPEESTERTVEEILSRLPPLEVEAIRWEESQSPPASPPPPREVTHDDVLRLHDEHIECLNGCADHSGIRTTAGEEGFSEWHEVVSRTSYNGELLHILPYVVID